MDFKQIQELIRMVNKTNIGEVSVEENGFKLTIKQKKDAAPVYMQGMPAMAAPPPMPAAAAPAASTPAAAAISPSASAPKSAEAGTVTIKSPMIGTFYRSSSPDKPPLVSVGDEVKPGQVVCIIEAMKLFNEIESEVKGRIVKVLVDDASPVEYDQPLYLVEPA